MHASHEKNRLAAFLVAPDLWTIATGWNYFQWSDRRRVFIGPVCSITRNGPVITIFERSPEVRPT